MCIRDRVGASLRTKINVNLGTSRDMKDMDSELAKVKSAVDMGAEAIMDLSSYGDTRKFRTELTRTCPAIIGTVPIDVYKRQVIVRQVLWDSLSNSLKYRPPE